MRSKRRQKQKKADLQSFDDRCVLHDPLCCGRLVSVLLLAFAFGGINAKGDLAAAINELGGIAMGLMWPILGGYVAFSIADRPGLVPGMVAGMIASNMNAGFLGALLGGFLAGYTVQLLKKVLKLPPAFSGLLPVLILPVISVLFVGLIMKFVVGIPITALNEGITNWLTACQE